MLMKELNTMHEALMRQERVEMGHEWGILLHFIYLPYGNKRKYFSCFSSLKMPRCLFYGTLVHCRQSTYPLSGTISYRHTLKRRTYSHNSSVYNYSVRLL